MRRPSILLYGNCVMEGVHSALSRIPRLAESYDLHFVRSKSACVVPARELQQACEIFVYHPDHTMPPFAKDILERRGGIRMPMVCCTVLWPGEAAARHDPRYPQYPNSPYPFGEPLIADLVRRHADDAEVVERYLELDFARLFPLQAMFLKWQRVLEKLEREATVKISDFILEHWRDRRLFWDLLHPANEVVGELSRRLLTVLRMPVDREAQMLHEVREWNSVTKPVHPSVARAFRLGWVRDDDRYGHLGDDDVDRREWYARYTAYLRDLMRTTPEPFHKGRAAEGFGVQGNA